jgi:hypothetical protein
MTTKITLNIDRRLAERAYKYAREKKTSIDKIIEEQVSSLLNTKEDEIVPAVKQLAGILKSVRVNDAKKEYREYVSKKHSA